MIERGRDEPGDIDLRNRAVPGGCARAGGCNLAFHERNHLRNRSMMRLRDQRLDPGVGDRPQHDADFGIEKVKSKPASTPCAPGSLLGNDLRDGLALAPGVIVGSRPAIRASIRSPGSCRSGRNARAELVAGDRIWPVPIRSWSWCSDTRSPT